MQHRLGLQPGRQVRAGCCYPIPHPIYSTDTPVLDGLNRTGLHPIMRAGRMSESSHDRGGGSRWLARPTHDRRRPRCTKGAQGSRLPGWSARMEPDSPESAVYLTSPDGSDGPGWTFSCRLRLPQASVAFDVQGAFFGRRVIIAALLRSLSGEACRVLLGRGGWLLPGRLRPFGSSSS